MAGPLANARHERFAQELAKGAPATVAYVSAGYLANDGNAGRLNRNEQVLVRAAELKERAAAKVELSIASITERLLGIADKAEVTSLGAAGLSVARAAMMDAAKLNGMIPDKVEHSGPGGGPIRFDVAHLTMEQLLLLKSLKPIVLPE